MSLPEDDPARQLAALQREVRQLISTGEFERALALSEQAREAAGPMQPADAHDPSAPARLRCEAALRFVGCLVKLERFEPAVEQAHAILQRLRDGPPSALRAELLVRTAFALTQLSRHEPAMRAAHLALHDALALDEGLLAAQALERIAMSAMSLGDPLTAERFMLEALGFYEQTREPEHMLRGSSNALFLYCNAHDLMRDTGHADAAAAFLLRSRRVVTMSQGVVDSAPASSYLACMWRANQGRWLLRRGQRDEAQALLERIHLQASERGWYPIRRPVALELARVREAEGRLREAVSLLHSVFEPHQSSPRDRIARKVYARLPQLYERLGDRDAAARYRDERDAINRRIAAEIERASAHLGDLADLATAMLTQADQRRLEDELARLRTHPRPSQLAPLD